MKSILIIVLLCFSLLSFSQTKKIPFIDTKITIDGKFDENVWSTLPTQTGFFNHLPTDEGLAENQTNVKLFHNGTHLYVSAIYNDTTSRIQVSSLKRDVSIGISDAFILVLDTQNQKQNGNLFAVNSYGTQVDGLIERANDGFNLNFNWSAVWEAKTKVNGTQKNYEIAIPLKGLNFNKRNSTFGVQFYVRDIKNNSWTIFSNVKRNYATFDLRFLTPFEVEALPQKSASKFAVTPSVTLNYQNDNASNTNETTFKPSLDVQYNLTSSLKLDATINPDFSQIDVDEQVTNLTRFAINFPERRNFFLENADLFSNLGVDEVNPFYSRRIGSESVIEFGLKLSGNIAAKTRIGVLNVQTDSEATVNAQNFGVLVAEQQMTKNFTATAFLINKQSKEAYNRVGGVNINYKSTDNKWLGLANFGKSFTSDIIDNSNFYHLGIWYNKRGFSWNVSAKNVQENFITSVGFTPRLYNYDAITNEIVREGYTQTSAGVEYEKFYNDSKTINFIRFFNYSNDMYFDEVGKLNQTSHYLNSALFFKDLSAVYYVLTYDDLDLKYGFDPLGNGNSLVPGDYQFGMLKIGYNSASNKKLIYQINAQKGTYYGGERLTAGAYLNYQLLPFANIETSYNLNKIDLDELGAATFHLARFTGEVFFNNQLNWTTYVQYNTQGDNFNVNTRLQWEYKPLSYVYLVVTDNFNKQLERQNWGVAFKMNYRFDF